MGRTLRTGKGQGGCYLVTFLISFLGGTQRWFIGGMALVMEKASTKVHSRFEDGGSLLGESYLVFVGAGSRDGS